MTGNDLSCMVTLNYKLKLINMLLSNDVNRRKYTLWIVQRRGWLVQINNLSILQSHSHCISSWCCCLQNVMLVHSALSVQWCVIVRTVFLVIGSLECVPARAHRVGLAPAVRQVGLRWLWVTHIVVFWFFCFQLRCIVPKLSSKEKMNLCSTSSWNLWWAACVSALWTRYNRDMSKL